MIVMKFGGSPVESAKAIQRVASIVRDHSGCPPTVVVSAMGKTTDRLLAIAHLYADGNMKAAGQALAKLQRFHLTEASCLARGTQAGWLNNQICALFEELDQVLKEVRECGSLTPRLSDAVLSFGERLSSVMVTAGFRQMGIDAVHLDARSSIVTDGKHTQAAPLFIETNALLRRRISRVQVTVMGGFIAATEDGVPTTLGRGGSDYTAAIVGAALAADEVQIWTDVDGMLTCDPRVVSGAHCLRSISYAEAEQMAKAGAKVLHPATVLPAIRQRIPIVIRNSRNPGAAGTRIVRENPCDGTVMSIACRSGIALLQVIPRNTRLAVDAAANLYIADRNEDFVLKVADSTGIITTVAGVGHVGFGGDGGAGTSAALYSPNSVSLDSSGNLYIADSGNEVIRKVAAGTGIITTAAGKYGGSATRIRTSRYDRLSSRAENIANGVVAFPAPIRFCYRSNRKLSAR